MELQLEQVGDDYLIATYEGRRINVRRQADGTWRANCRKIPNLKSRWRADGPTAVAAIEDVCRQIDREPELGQKIAPGPLSECRWDFEDDIPDDF